MFITRQHVPVWQPPKTLFNVSNAGSTQVKVIWPGSLTVTLPDKGTGRIADIQSSGNSVGGVFAVDSTWSNVLLDFAGAGNADLTLTVEIGKVMESGVLTYPIASVALKSITTSGTTTADVNPFNGETLSSFTPRLFDLVTITNYGNLGQVLTNIGGTENEKPSQLVLNVTEAPYYYVIVTSLGTLTKALGVITPQY